MNEWVNEWMNEWVSEWMNEWVNESTQGSVIEEHKQEFKKFATCASNRWMTPSNVGRCAIWSGLPGLPPAWCYRVQTSPACHTYRTYTEEISCSEGIKLWARRTIFRSSRDFTGTTWTHTTHGGVRIRRLIANSTACNSDDELDQ